MATERTEAERLATHARNWQAWAAEAHNEAARCMDRRLLKMAIGFQNDAAHFSRAARERLFVLIGAEEED